MATISKRGNYYQAKIRRTGYPSVTHTFDTQKQAREWARQIESQMDRGEYTPQTELKDTTLRDLLGSVDIYRSQISAPTKDKKLM